MRVRALTFESVPRPVVRNGQGANICNPRLRLIDLQSLGRPVRPARHRIISSSFQNARECHLSLPDANRIQVRGYQVVRTETEVRSTSNQPNAGVVATESFTHCCHVRKLTRHGGETNHSRASRTYCCTRLSRRFVAERR